MIKDGPGHSFERRICPRVELKGLIGLPKNPGSALVVDISAGGAQVTFPSRLVPGNLYEMVLTFPDRKILARARVTRSIDLEGDGAVCIAGLEFQGLDSDDRRFLEKYVARMANPDISINQQSN